MILDHNGNPITRHERKRYQLRYDAAQTSHMNSRHWVAADDLDAVDALSPDVRKRLRERCRHEVQNNEYARGIADSIVTYVIGTGPRLQVTTGDAELDAFAEREWSAWCERHDMRAEISLARRSEFESGEVFVELVVRDGELYLITIEADRVASFDGLAGDGVDVDDLGRPVSYTVQTEVYGRPVNIPASRMLHMFRRVRPGQIRGIPELTPGIETLAQLRRYMQAALDAAEQAARLAGYMITDAPPGEGPAQFGGDGDAHISDLPTMRPERGEFQFLPEGWEPKQLSPEQPQANFSDVVHTYLSRIGRICQIPVMIVTGDASNHNFASGRLDYQAFLGWIKTEQVRLETRFLDPIFDSWRRASVLTEDSSGADRAMRTQLAELARVSRRWYWPAVEHIDEVKAANAAKVRLASGVSTPQEECARRGIDAEASLEKAAEYYGISVDEMRRVYLESTFPTVETMIEIVDDDEESEMTNE